MGALTIYLAELIAIKEGLQLARMHGILISNVECDAINIVSMINSHFFKSIDGIIVKDIAILLDVVKGDNCYQVS